MSLFKKYFLNCGRTLTRYGFHKLWLELYGESGKIPTLICPPEMINENQSDITFNEKLISIYDSYAFGVLMYEILTKQILNEEEPFDRNLIDANLQGSENLFLRELIRSSTDTNPKNRPYNPFVSYVTTFVTILQKQMKPILLKSYCVSCQANGDSKAEEYITTSINKATDQKTPFIKGISERRPLLQNPVAISFIIGKKVFHNIEAFEKKLSNIEPGKRIIFITIFGGFQMGKSTTLYLLSGNEKYVLGDGIDETTRGVSIDGPYKLSHFNNAFGKIQTNNKNFDKDFPALTNEEIIKEDPYVFLVDAEGYDGDVNGFDNETNLKLYKDLIRPYLALSTNLLLLCDKAQGRSSRDFAIDNLSITKFADPHDLNMLSLMILIRNVDKFKFLEREYEFNDPFNKKQFEDTAMKFKEKFNHNFGENGITTIFSPLSLFETHYQKDLPNGEIPLFDKSFIVMARKILNEISHLHSTTHITNKNGAIELFKVLSEANQMESEEDEASKIREEQEKAYKTLLQERFKEAKDSAVEFMTNEINNDFNTITLLNTNQIESRTADWMKKFQDKYFELIDHDEFTRTRNVFGFKENNLLEGRSAIDEVIKENIQKKNVGNLKAQITVIIMKIMSDITHNIEHKILSANGWDYYQKNFKNNEFKQRKYEKLETEIANDPLVKNVDDIEIKNWMKEHIESLKEPFFNKIKFIFDWTDGILAKQRTPELRHGPKRSIPGNKNYVSQKTKLIWTCPSGKEIVETQTVEIQKEGICLLI
ncbi:hypothetical protein M9Y10_018149 [Tritrichomonas musculus]|uniref:Protein kinase domain-containing protein n=1 Tax=Tritrichomonas musculus TaxID=1915356 RepID=A0ABR2GKH4_9EUKA